MLDLDVVPERSLGCEQWEFVLGMHFSQAVAIIQAQVGVIKGVQVHYSDTNPLDSDLVLYLPQDGIRFLFDPVSQRLKVIVVSNMKLIKLKYCGLTFNSTEILPTIQEIERCFGATHPGIYDSEKQLFTLNFRGLSFCFDVDSKFQPGTAQCGLGSLQFVSGTCPIVSKMVIYSGSNLKINQLNDKLCCVPVMPLPVSCYYGLPYVEKATLIREKNCTKGIHLILYLQGSGSCRRQRIAVTKEIYFGMSCQEIASLLGSPSQVFYKSEDKMKIHSPNAHLNVTTPIRSDYFFNYFSLGLDLLFDAKSQRMKKFIVHTNYPGHYNFNIYNRCNFYINLMSEKQATYNLDSKKASRVQSVVVTAYTRWDQVSDSIKHSERPVVLNRATCASVMNPFGSTFCYGYQDMIFEVMQNQHIASVTFHKAAFDTTDHNMITDALNTLSIKKKSVLA